MGDGPGDPDLRLYRDIIRQEPNAHRIQVFNSSLIPALLWTQEYAAREQYRLGNPGQTEDELAELLAILKRRQHILEREKPPFYWAIMDEAVLMRPFGGRERMAAQLRYLLELAERSRITVQVLPFVQGAHSMPGAILTVLTMESGKTIALTEGLTVGEATEEPGRLLLLTQVFDIARSMALPEVDSLNLVRQYLKEYEEDDLHA